MTDKSLRLKERPFKHAAAAFLAQHRADEALTLFYNYRVKKADLIRTQDLIESYYAFLMGHYPSLNSTELLTLAKGFTYLTQADICHTGRLD